MLSNEMRNEIDLNRNNMIIKEEPITDRSIHFLIPALSPDEPSHILSLPEIFAIQQSPLEIPLPSGKYILAPSPSELFHYYQSVQPQMNSIISSSEGIINHLTSENFIHIVENLSEYSIPCQILQNHIIPCVDKSTSMISIDHSCRSFDEVTSNQATTEYYFHPPSPSYEIDPIGDDPNLFIHNKQFISKYYSSDISYLNNCVSNSSNSSSNCDVNIEWTSLPVCHGRTISSSSSDNNLWKKVRSNGNHNKKMKIRNSRKRTKFSNNDLEILNIFFEKNPMPSRADISILSEQLAYPRYIVQVWFYNKRQSLKRANSSSSQLDNNTQRIIK